MSRFVHENIYRRVRRRRDIFLKEEVNLDTMLKFLNFDCYQIIIRVHAELYAKRLKKTCVLRYRKKYYKTWCPLKKSSFSTPASRTRNFRMLLIEKWEKEIQLKRFLTYELSKKFQVKVVQKGTIENLSLKSWIFFKFSISIINVLSFDSCIDFLFFFSPSRIKSIIENWCQFNFQLSFDPLHGSKVRSIRG